MESPALFHALVRRLSGVTNTSRRWFYHPPDVIFRVVDLACEEVADYCRDLLRMSLKRKVTSVEEMDFGIGNIPPEGLSTTRQEKRIIPSPHRQEPRFVRPEIILERRVERDVALVVAEEVQLQLVGAGTG